MTLTETRDDVRRGATAESGGVELELGGHKAETLAAADLIVASPGVPPSSRRSRRRAAAGCESIGELEFAWRWLRAA